MYLIHLFKKFSIILAFSYPLKGVVCKLSLIVCDGYDIRIANLYLVYVIILKLNI